MPLARLKTALLLACALAALLATAANGALVEVEGLVLRADGGFQPQKLPRHGYAPIHFQGHVGIAAKDGGRPSPLRQAVVDFDRDGRLSVKGLATCPPDRVAAVNSEAARQLCRAAIVGTGKLRLMVALPSGNVSASSPLTIFNGPPVGGQPTALLQTQVAVPSPQTYVIEVPIERRPGEFRYRVTLDIPPLASGLGAITGLEVDVGRRYSAGGQRRSYVSARCSDGILRTHGRFSFEDGTVIDGSVEKFCLGT